MLDRVSLLTVIVICLLCASSVLVSCGGQGAVDPQPAADLQLALPGLPDGKAPAELSGDIIEGNETFQTSLNAVPQDSDLELVSGTNTTCWGIWRLQPGEDELLGVEVQLSTSGDDVAWVAFANYDLGRWEFAGPLSTGQQFPLDNADHRSPAGNCFVAVVTSGGNSATVNRLVMTEDRVGWQVVTVDKSGFSGTQASLVVIDGKPAISYYDDSVAEALKFIRSATDTGADPEDWGEPTAVYTGWIAFSDLAVVEGTPAVCFWLQGNLIYARSSTVDGADPLDWNAATVDNDDNAGHHCSLAVVDGNPAIAYWNNPDVQVSNLLYVRSTTTTGENSSDWPTPLVIESGGYTGHYSSLAVVGGNPAIAYYDEDSSEVKYARATTASGADLADWSQFAVVDNIEFSGAYMSLAVVDGNPAMSYWDSKNDELKYARSLTADGAQSADWLQKVVVHADVQPLGIGVNTSLAVINGLPAIAYPRTEPGRSLGLAQSSTSTGGDSADWASKQVADDEDNVGTHCSLASVGGRPAIAYYDETNYHLKYAILYE